MTIFKPREMANKLNVSVRTLQAWDNNGVLVAKRSPTNRRFYTDEQLQEYLRNAERRSKDELAQDSQDKR